MKTNQQLLIENLEALVNIARRGQLDKRIRRRYRELAEDVIQKYISDPEEQTDYREEFREMLK
jgi:hypothetical protein